MSKIHSVDTEYLEDADREFHIEVLKGGMNRLLFRSDRRADSELRIEILFMNVRYLSVGTQILNPQIRQLGRVKEYAHRVPWSIDSPDLLLFSIQGAAGEGLIVAGSMSVDKSNASPSDSSSFFMMD